MRMRGWKKVLTYAVLVLGVLCTAGISGTIGWRPFIGPKVRPLTERRFDPTPGRLERGRYLATTGGVACVLCHSELTPTADGVAIVPGTEFAGRNWAPDGTPFVTAGNLTPDPETGIGSRSDDALARAIREGISHDGRALFPIMPYEKLRVMSDEDVASVIVFLRSLAPIKRDLPRTAIPFPLSRLINGVPQPVDGSVTADLSTPVKRGEYLASLAVCADCHTPMDAQGNRTPNMEFAGGTTLTFDGWKPAASANLTPAVNGIPYYTEELFIEALRTGRVRERKLNDMMPWQFYRHMTDQDLKDLFAYLKTLAPIEHYVDNAMAPTDCARCGLKHGGGGRNKGNGE
jgi:mono/diheme cytochrome c family protein